MPGKSTLPESHLPSHISSPQSTHTRWMMLQTHIPASVLPMLRLWARVCCESGELEPGKIRVWLQQGRGLGGQAWEGSALKVFSMHWKQSASGVVPWQVMELPYRRKNGSYCWGEWGAERSRLEWGKEGSKSVTLCLRRSCWLEEGKLWGRMEELLVNFSGMVLRDWWPPGSVW